LGRDPLKQTVSAMRYYCLRTVDRIFHPAYIHTVKSCKELHAEAYSEGGHAARDPFDDLGSIVGESLERGREGADARKHERIPIERLGPVVRDEDVGARVLESLSERVQVADPVVEERDAEG